uniref:Transposon Ty3-I Gag-Pol polyprotein n=1 Tax=Cajanus cajan TaxID=3821 RepID=A0A151RZC9_CAJCA|nr:Transposon Ty3-I Gag-Pol polyprotein [Cajanus cajan]
MCVEYTDLNKACPKDAYPLQSIDRLVDGASGPALHSFLDTYSGYNQIMVYPPDGVHTSFITDHTNFCYRVMSFGLKNVGATYQRLMDKVFHRQSTTQETPYRMTYEADAMILVEVDETSHRRHTFDSEQNVQETKINLDLIDELREEARIHEEACKLQASRRYNTRVRPRSFRVGDLVWRLQGKARRDPSEGKLAPNWDGPF